MDLNGMDVDGLRIQFCKSVTDRGDTVMLAFNIEG